MRNFIISGIVLSFLVFSNNVFSNLPQQNPEELSGIALEAMASGSVVGPTNVFVGLEYEYYYTATNYEPGMGWAAPRGVTNLGDGRFIFNEPGKFVIRFLTATGGATLTVTAVHGIIIDPDRPE